MVRRSLLSSHIHVGLLPICLWFVLQATPPAEQGSFTPPTPATEAQVVAAFKATHDGWSVDEVLLDDQRRSRFLDACPAMPPANNADQASLAQRTKIADAHCRALLHVRKAGGRLPKASRRAERPSKASAAQTEAIAEIAARRLEDELACHTDALLTNSAARKFFDATVRKITAADSAYHFRKSAVRLRKTRRLEPEFVSRVTDWRRTILEFSVEQLRSDPRLVPKRPGVYLFRDTTGFLYIGQASQLYSRIKEHTQESDRKALAEYLSNGATDQITVELHVFESGSPGENLRMRRAYESDLIRTRKPKLNLAP